MLLYANELFVIYFENGFRESPLTKSKENQVIYSQDLSRNLKFRYI